VTLLILFVAFWLGIVLRNSPLAVSAISVLVLTYALKRLSKKIAVVSLLVLSIGVSISFINIDIKKESYEGVVIEVTNNYYLLSSDFEIIYIYEKETDKEIGDVLIVYGIKEKINSEKIESKFNFDDYLKSKGVSYQIYPKRTDVKSYSPIRVNKMRKEFIANFSGEVGSLVSSIMFSRRDNSEIISKFSSLNILRLCSAGGLYISFFLKVIEAFLKKRLSDKVSRVVAFTVLVPYFLFVFPKPSLIRISTIFIIRFTNDFLLKKKLSYLSIIAISGFSILMLDFHFALQDGFIIGYLASIFAHFLVNSFKHVKGIKKKTLTVLTLYLFLLPLEISYYHDFSLLEPLIQVAIFPFLLVFMLFSLLCFYKVPIFSIVEKLYMPINELLSFINKINVSFHIPKMSVLLVIVYELLFIAMIYFASIKLKPMKRIFGVIVTSFLTFYILPINNTFSNEVSFINVGQGDSILIRNRFKTALIDTGGSLKYDVAKEALIPYLKSKRIYAIDYLIVTHDDYDHMGARDSLIKNFKVSNYVDKHEMFPLNVGGVILNSLNSYAKEENDNDNSLVISFTVSKTRYLLMGDASKRIEQKLIKENIDLSSDIIKIGHHGSKTSTSEEFINKVNPKEAVVSVGRNKYGHPTEEVIRMLEKYRITIRRTDIEGTITYYSM